MFSDLYVIKVETARDLTFLILYILTNKRRPFVEGRGRILREKMRNGNNAK